MPVCIGPGPTALTVIPSSPSSTASERVSPTTPCFAAVYADADGEPPTPSVEEMFIIRGCSDFRRYGKAARIVVV